MSEPAQHSGPTVATVALNTLQQQCNEEVQAALDALPKQERLAASRMQQHSASPSITAEDVTVVPSTCALKGTVCLDPQQPVDRVTQQHA